MIGFLLCSLVTLLTLLLEMRTVFADINKLSIPSLPIPSSSSLSLSSSSLASGSASLVASSHISSSVTSLTETTHHIEETSRSSIDALHPHSNANILESLNTDQSWSQGFHVPENKITPSKSSSNRIQDKKITQTNEMTRTKRGSFNRIATEKQKRILRAVEKLFLKNVGLQRRPRISPESAVPMYMLDLYNILNGDSDGSRTYLKLKGNGLKAANTVRSFLHTDLESKTCQQPSCSSIHFDISSIPEHETITGAELRIFADTTDTCSKDGGQTSAPQPGQVSLRSAHGTVNRIEVHEIMHQGSSGSGAISRLLDTHVVAQGNLTWHTFDIRPAVLKWKKGHIFNHGLEVRLLTKTPYLSVDNQVRINKSIHLTEKEWGHQRPLLVVYTNDGASSLSRSSSTSSSTPGLKLLSRLRRTKRQVSGDNKKDKKRTREKKKKKKKRRNKKGNKNICKRHSLYVDFNDVGWDDWIVAPSGYNAYYCHGDCLTPLPHFTKATSHAMLQARLYKVNPSLVPMVCCVPSKMSPISMLYRDEKGRTVLKNYRDMTVEECGCR